MSVCDQVLVVDESPLARRLLRSALEGPDCWVHEAKDAAAARELLGVRAYDLLVVGRIGFDLLPLARSSGAAVIVCFAKHEGVAQEVVRSARRLLHVPATPVRNRPRAFARPSVAA